MLNLSSPVNENMESDTIKKHKSKKQIKISLEFVFSFPSSSIPTLLTCHTEWLTVMKFREFQTKPSWPTYLTWHTYLQKTCSTIQTLTWAVSQFLRHLNIILGSKYSRRVACGEAVRLRRPHCSNIRWDQKNLLQKAETISRHTSYLVVKDY